MSTLGELFANQFMEEPPKDAVDKGILQKMAESMGADSLMYLPLSKIPPCIGVPAQELCMACVNGDYPTPGGQKLLDLAKEHQKNGIAGRTTGA